MSRTLVCGPVEVERKKVRNLRFRFKEEDDENDTILNPNDDDRLLTTWQNNFCKIRRAFRIEIFKPLLD